MPLAETAPRVVRAPRGTEISCRGWQQEAALRMLMNNLDPEVAERPEQIIVYGGIGKAARNWECFDAIVATLKRLKNDETLLVQSGKPVGVFKTHADAPRVLLANSNLVPKWATWEHFNELDRQGLFMYGQMTAGSWIYIGTQGIVQGTYETFAEAGRQHCGGDLAGRWVLTAGLGGMGGAQPLAASFAGAVSLTVECQQASIDFRLRTRYLDKQARDLDDAIRISNDSEYGLTGAIYCRDSRHISRAKEECHVGNLYINRKCTGALVGVHPFGGFNMSGTDSKAGGRDYLLLFTQAKSISEAL